MFVISLLVIESDSGAVSDIARMVKTVGAKVDIIATAPDLVTGVRSTASPPDIVVLGVNDVERGARDVSLILSRWPNAAVFVTTAGKDPDCILRLIRSGASEYLAKPIVTAEFTQAVGKVVRNLSQRHGGSTEGTAITVYHPSGGMGTTTVAVNLAAALASQGEKVALVDLNLFCGNVNSFLDLTPRYTLESITTNMGRVDGSFVMSVMERHASGVHVLSGPASLEDSHEVTPADLQEVIGVMRELFRYIVIDCGGAITDCNRAVFSASDHILYTTVLDFPALKTAKRYLPVLTQMGKSGSQLKLVVNRHNPRGDIKVVDAERILNLRAYSTIPNAYADVKGSINKGVPVVTCCPKSPVTKAIHELGDLLKQEETSTPISQRTL